MFINTHNIVVLYFSHNLRNSTLNFYLKWKK